MIADAFAIMDLVEAYASKVSAYDKARGFGRGIEQAETERESARKALIEKIVSLSIKG